MGLSCSRLKLNLTPILFLLMFILNPFCFLNLQFLSCSRCSSLLFFSSLKITHILGHRPSMCPFPWPICQGGSGICWRWYFWGWCWIGWDDCYILSSRPHQDFHHEKCFFKGLLELTCLSTFTGGGRNQVHPVEDMVASLWMSVPQCPSRKILEDNLIWALDFGPKDM